MTKQAMQQALEALEEAEKTIRAREVHSAIINHDDPEIAGELVLSCRAAISSLREAMESEPAAQPQPMVAKQHAYTIKLPDGDARKARVVWVDRESVGGLLEHKLCVYIDQAPAAREPAAASPQQGEG